LISWTNAVFTTIPVYLDDGSSTDYHINVPAVIADLPVTPNYVYFTVPSVLDGAPIVPGTYAIQFGIAPDVAYGGPVVITTAGEQVPPTTPPVVVVTTDTTVVVAPPTTTTTAAAAATTTTATTTAAAAPATTTTAAPAKSSGSTISPLSLGALLVLVHLALLAL
jgi:hypothetical protein